MASKFLIIVDRKIDQREKTSLELAEVKGNESGHRNFTERIAGHQSEERICKFVGQLYVPIFPFHVLSRL